MTSTFDAFFTEEFPRLVAMLTARSGSRAVAEDLAQDALLQAQRQWDRVVGLDNPGAWVRRVALNRSKNEWRRRGRERLALRRIVPTPDADDAPPLPDAELWDRVRALPARQRDAILLRHVDDLGVPEIAEVMGCGEGTVRTHLQRGRAALARSHPFDATGSDGHDTIEGRQR